VNQYWFVNKVCWLKYLPVKLVFWFWCSEDHKSCFTFLAHPVYQTLYRKAANVVHVYYSIILHVTVANCFYKQFAGTD